MKIVTITLLLMLSAGAQFCLAQSGTPSVPEANPGRPTVSTPATLTPVGYLQFENGALFAEDSAEFSKRFGIEQVTKLSVLPRLELFLQSEPLAFSQSESQTEVHEGEVFAGVQSVLFAGGESRPTVSISYVRRVHTSAAPELDVGTFRQSTSILVSEDLHGFHFDTNGILAEQVQGDVRRAQFGQTLSISHSLGKFTISGEVWHFSQPFEKGNTVGNLWAVSRALRKNLVVDAGFNRGLTKTSTRWEAFVGFTYLLPHRLWTARPGFQP
ncbi:MAG TPA: hypothetical protein VJ255_12065 [Candidatus Acidoferrum sp.]|nr:hypothetical protein [Candidatus Acidoferrum sp.]